MANNLEQLHEGFKNELQDLESIVEHADDYTLKAKRNKFINQMNTITSNLEGLCDALYSEFDETNDIKIEYDELHVKYTALLEMFDDKLSDDDKIYLRIKHGISEWRY